MPEPNIPQTFNPAGFMPIDTTPELPLELRMEAERIEWEKAQSQKETEE